MMSFSILSRNSSKTLACALAFSPVLPALAQTPLSTPTPKTSASNTISAPNPAANAIRIEINGAPVVSDPAPILLTGSVYVPLRGVLENLGAQVSYFAADERIEIRQTGRLVVLRLGKTGALVDGQTVELVPPLVRSGRAFVPLRALAELFGYSVDWTPPTRTVSISAIAPSLVNHRLHLENAGRYGVAVDFHQFPREQVGPLLDAAREAGATLVKTKFDWGTLQNARGAAFDWELYDLVVSEARKRNLTLVGILGDTAPWASSFTGPSQDTARRSPVREADWPLWSTYVQRVVGRYRTDVHAWQVWTAPNATNWLSVPRNYRRLAQTATDAARQVDRNVVIFLADPGGADVQSFSDWRNAGILGATDGVSLHPVASWQQGTLAAPEEFVRPYTEIRESAKGIEGKRRDFWLGGIQFPVAAETDKARVGDAEAKALAVFTPQTQADFLVKSFALSHALGSPKLFWGTLRDTPLQSVRGISLAPGLQTETGEARPSLGAFKAFASIVGDKPFDRAISFSNGVTALLFDDKRSGVAVVWSPRGQGTLALTTTGINPQTETATWIDMRPDGRILNALGQEVGVPSGLQEVGLSPIFLTGISAQTLKEAPSVPLRFQSAGDYATATEVSANLDEETPESGLYFRKYANFPAEAQFYNRVGGRVGLTTQPQYNPTDLKSMKPFIHLDVDDDFAFNTINQRFEIEIEVKRPQGGESGPATSTAGFRIEFDGLSGDRSSKFFEIAPGEGWETITFPLLEAQFAGAGGYDILIDAAGSKKALTFGKITLRKLAL